ncbi:MAG: Rrf2 family transcriptional regulator [Treponema sp.]|nr:Rrf2 family transcriptional regulator [Treponema sp.]
MLKISTRGQYALLIMTSLAEQNPEKYTPLKILSHRHNLSIKYLEQILIQLSKSGLVAGLRGNNGGYKLVKKPSEYTVGEILRSTEGEISVHSTGEGKSISDVGNDFFWNDFDTKINSYLDGISLQFLVEKNKEATGYDYFI